jgi:molybdate transport system substrate-binding protein
MKGWRVVFEAVTVMLISLLAPAGHAGMVYVTAASDLQYCMKDIVDVFEAKYPGDKVKMVFGSSGKAFSQIVAGAPYDIYFAADVAYPEKLRQDGFAISNPKPYAIGRMTLWVTKKSGLDPHKGIQLLLDSGVKKIAIADPAHAPYGRIAVEIMKYHRVYDQAEKRLVLGTNIQQTAQFVQSGAADVGFIAYSLALAPILEKQGRFFLFPAESHTEILQAYVLLKPAALNQTAKRFEAFVGSAEARVIFKRYGFRLPHE